jgi:hypothetical protein
MRLAALMTVVAAWGCRFGFDEQDPFETALVVEPAYPDAAGLTDWVEADGSNAPCDGDAIVGGSERGRDACIHAGLKLQAVAPGASCSGLSASDALGWFTWRCEQRGNSAAFVTDRLAMGVTLRSLVDVGGIRANTLEVREAGSVVAQSESAAWWSNPVVPLTTAGTLDAARTIYIASTSISGNLSIRAPGIALATTDGGQLGAIDADASSSYAWIDAFGAAGVSVIGAGFVTVSGLVLDGGVAFDTTTACEVRDLRGLEGGISISQSPWARVYHVQVQSAGYGVYIANSSDVRLHDFESANASASGVEALGASPRLVMTDIVATNNGFEAIQIDDAADDAILVGALAAYSLDEGVMFRGVDRATISHVTSIGHEQFGVSTYLGADYASVSQINAFNNGYYGLFVRGSLHGLYGQIATANNAVNGTRVYQNADFNTFIYALLGGPGTLCVVDGGGVDNNSVISDDTVAGTVCGGDDPALQFRATTGLTQDGTLGGAVAGDTTNSQAGQAVDAAQIADWIDFDSPYRFWGPGASAMFLDGANRLDCRTPELCRAWDARLLEGNPFVGTSGTGRTPNEPFTAGAPCPAAVDGNMTFHNLRGTELAGDGIGNDNDICEPLERCSAEQSVFLVNARELIEDGAGNDNGLCESGEACVYSPNFGYYQGSGDPLTGPTCAFVDGSGPFGVTGVTLYAYPNR